jgi:hypothetical protein
VAEAELLGLERYAQKQQEPTPEPSAHRRSVNESSVTEPDQNQGPEQKNSAGVEDADAVEQQDHTQA